MEQSNLDSLDKDTIPSPSCAETIERFILNVESILNTSENPLRLKRYIGIFFYSLSNEGVVIQRYAQYIPESILNHKEFQNTIKEIFEERCDTNNIRELLINIIENPHIFKNIDFIYESTKIQETLSNYFKIMQNKRQNIDFLKRFIKQ